MRTALRFCFLALTASLPLTAPAADAPLPLDEHLQALQPFLGHTWRGEFKKSTPEKPIIDVSRWDRALNGKAVRVLHSINNGAYGGESIIHWDSEKNEIRYHYFTTAGFYTTGSMTITNNIITAVERVSGNGDGPDEVRSTYELRDDGTMLNQTQYYKAGGMTNSREVVYKRDAEAEVKFR